MWGHGSGVGSLPEHTVEYRDFLQQFMARHGVRSVVDVGCGDWQFSRYVDWSNVTYVGIDVVSSVVDNNQREFGNDNISFRKFLSLEKLPPADLLVCKDVLQHLPNATVKAYWGRSERNTNFHSSQTTRSRPTSRTSISISAAGEHFGWTKSRFASRAWSFSRGKYRGARRRRENRPTCSMETLGYHGELNE